VLGVAGVTPTDTPEGGWAGCGRGDRWDMLPLFRNHLAAVGSLAATSTMTVISVLLWQ
jgi:hypothetical protein